MPNTAAATRKLSRAYQHALELAAGTPSALWQAYTGLAAVYSAQGDFGNANSNYSKALAVITSSRADQLKADYEITFLSDLIRFYQDYVALLVQHGDYVRALEVADSSRASVLTDDLLGETTATRTGLVRQFQMAAKTSHAVFLFYWLAPRTSYLWLINGAQIKVIPLAGEKQISQDVNSYRALIEETKGDPLTPAPSHAGIQLYQELIASAAPFIPPDTQVFIVPDGVLHNLNFETLIVPSPQPHYWIEDATITVAPSLGILRAGKSVASTRRSLLLMGDPLTQGTDYTPLPEAKLEIENIQRRYPTSKVLSGSAALVDAYFSSNLRSSPPFTLPLTSTLTRKARSIRPLFYLRKEVISGFMPATSRKNR